MDTRGGQRLVAGEHARQDVALVPAADEEGDQRPCVQQRERERVARVRRRPTWLGDVDNRIGCLELGATGVERSRVAVRPEAEQDEVERRRKLDVGRAQRMDLVVGNADAIEERFTREPFVRVGVARRNVSLVAPPDMPVGPVEVVFGQSLVDRAGRRPAGERDAKAARTGALGDPARRMLA
jgi:hypothetical protein